MRYFPHVNLWEVATPVMHLLEPIRRRGLRRKLAAVHGRVPLTASTHVLDVGCGTGTLLAELARYRCHVTGVDPSRAMLRAARRRFPSVSLLQEPAHAMRSVPDASQDVSLVSSTLHGLRPDYRRLAYIELARVTRQLVAVIDYHRNLNPAVALIEWLEGGDYFRFVKVVESELAEAFPRLEVQRFPGYESLYLCWME
jgi:ubiquinone/menaquinone biosynthesis C-methylase UbiE